MSVLDAVRSLPEQFKKAVDDDTRNGPLQPRAITNVVLAGMGGSGVGADLAHALCTQYGNVPAVVVKSGELPAFVDDGSLVIATSFSGDTAEINTLVASAVERGAAVIAVTTGGRLAQDARAADVTTHLVDPSSPCPRTAIGSLSVPILRTLDEFGVLTGLPGTLEDHFSATLTQLETRREELLDDDGRAVRLARRIGRTMPLVYAVGPLGAAVAQRWKSQFNENPKIPAFTGVVPEITHNEVCGWAQHGDMTRQVFTLVCLRHSFEGERNAAAMDAVAEITDETVAGVHEVRAKGEGMLAQFFDLAMYGDFVSVRMALAEGIDPGPVPVLDQLKARLGA